jgi:hypothetical protein
MAILRKWNNLINNDPNVKNDIIFNDYYVIIDDNRKNLEEISTMDIYCNLLLTCSQRPTREERWEDESGLNFDSNDWAAIYTNIYSFTNDMKLVTFHYKITHRTLVCKRNLHRWKIKPVSVTSVKATQIVLNTT